MEIIILIIILFVMIYLASRKNESFDDNELSDEEQHEDYVSVRSYRYPYRWGRYPFWNYPTRYWNYYPYYRYNYPYRYWY